MSGDLVASIQVHFRHHGEDIADVTAAVAADRQQPRRKRLSSTWPTDLRLSGDAHQLLAHSQGALPRRLKLQMAKVVGRAKANVTAVEGIVTGEVVADADLLTGELRGGRTDLHAFGDGQVIVQIEI